VSSAQNIEEGAAAPGLELYRPIPNPFNRMMQMAYAVGEGGERVDVRVYDLAGRAVRTLESGFQAAGRHVATWDGRDNSGQLVRNAVYFVHVIVGDRPRVVRVAYLR